MKDTYNVMTVWKKVRPKIITGFPPERSKIFCFLYVYGEHFVPQDKFSEYLLEAYDLFRTEVCSDGFISVLEFATLVAGSGSDTLLNIIYTWGHNDAVRYTRVPSDLTETTYDFDYMYRLIKSAKR